MIYTLKSYDGTVSTAVRIDDSVLKIEYNPVNISRSGIMMEIVIVYVEGYEVVIEFIHGKFSEDDVTDFFDNIVQNWKRECVS
jgi:hypothetical protein